MIKEELKVYLAKLWPLLVVVVVLPLLSFLIWTLIPARSLNIIVIDKTVRNDAFQEHHSFYWVLKHKKYQDSKGRFYDESRDYYGFFPHGEADFGTARDFSGKSEQEIDSLVEATDLIMITDTYGVYEKDFKL